MPLGVLTVGYSTENCDNVCFRSIAHTPTTNPYVYRATEYSTEKEGIVMMSANAIYILYRRCPLKHRERETSDRLMSDIVILVNKVEDHCDRGGLQQCVSKHNQV